MTRTYNTKLQDSLGLVTCWSRQNRRRQSRQRDELSRTYLHAAWGLPWCKSWITA